MAKKLELPLGGVNLRWIALVAALLAACGPPPHPVAIGSAPAYGTVLGNQRRALYEDEAIPGAQPTIAWDVNAGAGMRGTLLLLDSVVIAATTNRELLAYQRATGRRHWQRRFGNAVTSTVLYDRNVLYVGTDENDGSLHAREITRGGERWRVRVGAVSTTPLLGPDVIYVGTQQGAVTALALENGSRRWRVGLPGAIAETLIDAGDHLVAFGTNDSIFALRKNDGALLASGVLPGTPSAAAALAGHTIIVPIHPGAVIGVDANSLAVLWRADAAAPVLTPAAIAEDGSAYVAARDGSVYRIRAGQAERIAQLEHALSGSLTLARDHLLLGSYDGTLTAVSLDGRVLWTYAFDDSIVAPVAVGDQSVYVPLLRGRIVKLR
jgi:outer membrane protein assembly factor BamB